MNYGSATEPWAILSRIPDNAAVCADSCIISTVLALSGQFSATKVAFFRRHFGPFPSVALA
jgi:hypothetical protein